MKTIRSRFHQDRRGIALVISLSVMAIVLLLVVGFIASMRTESAMARNYAFQSLSRTLAESALDMAITRIRTNTPVITTNQSYASGPGRLVRRNGVINNGTNVWVTTNIWLYSDKQIPSITNTFADFNSDRAIVSVNLAYPTPGAGFTSPVINASVYAIPIATNGAVAAAGKPLMGLIGFWVDDESTKININTASKRDPTHNMKSVASDVDLTVLEGTLPYAAISTYGQNTGFFTPEQLKSVPTVTTAMYEANKFYITTYSNDNGLNIWGGQKLNLNTLVPLANNPTAANLSSAISMIVSNLASPGLSNWFGQTFVDKYGSGQATQIAVNILSHINTNTIPLDSTTVGYTDTNPPSFLSIENTPQLHRMYLYDHVWTTVSGTLTTLGVNVSMLIELWNPTTYTIGWSNHLAGTECAFIGLPQATIMSGGTVLTSISPPTTYIYPVAANWSAGLLSGAPTYAPGGPNYQLKVYETIWTNQPPGVALPDNVVFSNATVTAILRSPNPTTNPQGLPGHRMSYARIPILMTNVTAVAGTLGFTWTLPINPAGGNVARGNWGVAQDAGSNDPRTRPVDNSWVPLTKDVYPNSTPSFGSFSAPVFNSSTNVNNIVGDGEAAPPGGMTCHVLAPSYRDKGRIDSVAELGLVHTGSPWRTFWFHQRGLQEKTNSPPLIPDWALTEIFSATNGNIQGRININAGSLGSSWNGAQRFQPLNAIVPVAAYLSAPAVTANIYSNFIGTALWIVGNGTSWGTYRSNGQFGFTPGLFNSVGELCEMQNIGWTGSGSNTTKFGTVQALTSYLDMLTTRSDTFTVWALGQAVRDVNTNGVYDAGIDQILAETRIQAVVQRVQYDPTFTGKLGTQLDGSNNNSNLYRVVYLRYITP